MLKQAAQRQGIGRSERLLEARGCLARPHDYAGASNDWTRPFGCRHGVNHPGTESVLFVQDRLGFRVDLLRRAQNSRMESEIVWHILPVFDQAVFVLLSCVHQQKLIHVETKLRRQLHEARESARLVDLAQPLRKLESIAVPDRSTFFLAECGAGASFDEAAELGRVILLVGERPIRAFEDFAMRHLVRSHLVNRCGTKPGDEKSRCCDFWPRLRDVACARKSMTCAGGVVAEKGRCRRPAAEVYK